MNFKERIAIAMWVFVIALFIGTAVDMLVKPTYHIVVINEDGRQQYSMTRCHYLSGCSLTIFRWNMDQYNKALAMYNDYVHPNAPAVIEKVIN